MKRWRQGLLAACLWPSTAFAVDGWEHLRPAPQTGPSCGFFANIPALTLATGVDVSTSPGFVRAVYGLRRGDFRFERSFDKRLFCELFALPWSETTVHHRGMDGPARIAATEELLRTRIAPGLADRRVYSLRVRGILGGPHNVLLLARDGEDYIVHNPYPGWIRGLSGRELADIMVVRSTARANRGKDVHLSSWLEIRLPEPPGGRGVSMAAIPEEIGGRLDPAVRSRMAGGLRPGVRLPEDPGLGDLIGAYQQLDFAALPPLRKGGAPVPAIGPEVGASELGGLLWLSKFKLANWQARRSKLLPVWFIDGAPWVLAGYRRPATGTPDLIFDNGREVRWIEGGEALRLMRAGGAVYATLDAGLRDP